MSRLGRRLGGLTGALSVLVLCTAAPSFAGGGLQQCLDKSLDHNGEPPTCTKVDGQWVASWPDDGMGSGSGIPGVFVFLMVLALMAAVGLTIWKVSTARRLATQSGMDPGLATQMTLLSDDGLDATYLASSLRSPATPAPTTSAAPAASGVASTASSRLEELKSLLDRGLVTQAEYDERRKAIIDSV